MINEKYSPEEVAAVVELVSDNPQGFIDLVDRFCEETTVHDVKRSLKAWGISYDQTSGNRSSRRGQKYRNR